MSSLSRKFAKGCRRWRWALAWHLKAARIPEPALVRRRRMMIGLVYVAVAIAAVVPLLVGIAKWWSAIAVLFLAALIAAWAVIGGRFRMHVARSDFKLCLECGYNLQGLPEKGRCPECGGEFQIDDVQRRWREHLWRA